MAIVAARDRLASSERTRKVRMLWLGDAPTGWILDRVSVSEQYRTVNV